MATVRSRTAIPYDQYTEELCKEWAKNPTVNPVTGKTIRMDTVKNGVFHKISAACEKFGVKPPSSMQEKPDKRALYKKHKLFVPINGYPFPESYIDHRYALRTSHQFAEKAIQAKMIIRADLIYMNATMTHFKNAKQVSYFEHEFNTTQANELYAMGEQLEKDLEKLRVDNVMIASNPMAVNRIADMLWNLVTDYLTHGTQPRDDQLELLENDAVTQSVYNKDSAAKVVLKEIKDFREIVHDIQLEKADHEKVEEDEFVPESRIRSSPDSLSASDSRSRKYSDSYKRHSKLSKVSPFANASPSQVAQLDTKTRQQILKELKVACTILKDTITYESFDRMNKKNLMLVVKLGKGDTNKHCYYVRNIYNAWKQAVKDNKPFVDPLNGVAVTTEEKDDIMKKMRYIKKDIKDPRDIAQKIPTAVQLYFKLMKHVDADGIIHQFYEILVRTKRKLGERILIVMRLGYVPADIEPRDAGGALNMSSAVLVSNIKKLFDTGRLFRNNEVPYRCCRIHLRKPIEYWLDPDGPKGISMHRFAMMVEEVERYL